jgi:hypothetical protein
VTIRMPYLIFVGLAGQMARENPGWGCKRIQGGKFGDRTTACGRLPPGMTGTGQTHESTGRGASLA